MGPIRGMYKKNVFVEQGPKEVETFSFLPLTEIRPVSFLTHNVQPNTYYNNNDNKNYNVLGDIILP